MAPKNRALKAFRLYQNYRLFFYMTLLKPLSLFGLPKISTKTLFRDFLAEKFTHSPQFSLGYRVRPNFIIWAGTTIVTSRNIKISTT